MAEVLGIAGLGVAIFALVCVVISLAIDYWVYAGTNALGFKFYAGLFKSCGENDAINYKDCSSDGASDELKAVVGMIFLGLLCIVITIICGCLKLLVMKEQKRLLFATTGLMVAAGLFLMIAFSVYVAELYNPVKSRFDLHAGFALCVIAWLASWVSAALYAIGITKGN